MKIKANRMYYFLHRKFKDWWFYGLWRQILYFAIFSIKKPEKLKILLIYTSGRTGSTVLCSTLSNSKAFEYEEEILRKKLIHFPSFVLGHAQKKRGSWYILKVKQMNLSRLDTTLVTFISELGNQFIYKVHLFRKNEFEHSISRFIAEKRNIYNSKKTPNTKQPKVNISYSNLREKIYWQKRENTLEKLETKGLEFIKLTYEDDICTSDKLICTQKLLFKALGVDENAVEPEYKKVLSKDLSQEILNWNEIKNLENV
ncbi:MAG: hypothetical protein JXQ87_14835 [Bacteroidia bacterium]